MAKKKGKSFYDEYAFKRLRNLGFDRTFANKIAKRKNAIDESLKLEELAGRFRGDATVAKDVFENKSSREWTSKQRKNFIQGENEYRIETKGKFAGQLTEKEKKLLDIHLREGDLKHAEKMIEKAVIDEESRLDKFKQWIGYGKRPPKYVKDEIKRINKELGVSAKSNQGMFVLREMVANGRTEEEAKAIIKEKPRKFANKEDIYYT